MPFMMSDVAAGSDAVMRLQQNAAAAPYVQESAALAIQKQQQDVEKERLQNLVTKTGFEQSQDAQRKLATLTGTPEYKSSSDSDRMRMIAKLQGEAGQSDAMEKSLMNADKLDMSELTKQAKQFELASKQISSAESVISNMPDDKVNESFERLDPKVKEAVFAQVPKAAWDKFTPKEKKDVLHDLMYSASNKLAEQRILAQQKQMQWRHDEALRRNEIMMQRLLLSRDKAEGDADNKVYSQFDRNVRTVNAGLAQEENRVRKQLELAQKSLDEIPVGSRTGWFGGEKQPYKDAQQRVLDAQDAVTKFEQKKARARIDAARRLPAGDAKETLLLEAQAAYDAEFGALEDAKIKPLPVEQDDLAASQKPSGKPAATAKPSAPAAAASKPAPKFEEGKIYTDAKGNKARYVNGKWEPV